MKDNQKIYLDKVIEFIVRDTKIDYEGKVMKFPFFRFYHQYLFTTHIKSTLNNTSYFKNYCKDVYGLTDQEIEYVWNQYKDIILDRIENGK